MKTLLKKYKKEASNIKTIIEFKRIEDYTIFDWKLDGRLMVLFEVIYDIELELANN